MDITELRNGNVRIECDKYSKLIELYEKFENDDKLEVNILQGRKRDGSRWSYVYRPYLYEQESPFMIARDTEFWVDFDESDNRDDVLAKCDDMNIDNWLIEEIIDEWECMEFENGETMRVFYDMNRGVDYVVTSESTRVKTDVYTHNLELELIPADPDSEENEEYLEQIFIELKTK